MPNHSPHLASTMGFVISMTQISGIQFNIHYHMHYALASNWNLFLTSSQKWNLFKFGSHKFPTCCKPATCRYWARSMEAQYFKPLKLESHHKLTLLMDSTYKGGVNCNLLTKHFHAFIICPHALKLELETCRLTIAQLILRF
jgi:hypothetical protein